MDIRFSSKAQNPDDSICFNSTGVSAGNLEYPDVVPSSDQTCKSSAERAMSSPGMLIAIMAFAGVALSMA